MRVSLRKVVSTSVRLPIGRVRVAATPRGVAAVAMGRVSRRAFARAVERRFGLEPEEWEPGRLEGSGLVSGRGPLPEAEAAREQGRVACSHLVRACRELQEYVAGSRRAFTFPVDLAECTGFQWAVLDVTSRIPWGEVRTYGQVARQTGRPRAARAVGGALSRNPVPIVIPCHRVVGSGGLGGFTGGLGLKRRLLAIEGRRTFDHRAT